jgi:uncharacterized protein (DUF1015 family)
MLSTRPKPLALAKGNPLSFLRVSRPEIDLPAGIDVYSAEVYSKGAENFEKLKAAAPMFVEETPSLYVYSPPHGRPHPIGNHSVLFDRRI